MRETHPVLSCAGAARWEAGLLGDDPGKVWSAMNRAGESLGRAILRDYGEIGYFPFSPRVLLLAGKGHNAGDAFLAGAAILRERPEARVDVCLAAGESGLSPLAGRAWEQLLKASRGGVRRVSLSHGSPAGSQLDAFFGPEPWDVVLDGLLGMNFRPPLRSPWPDLIDWINRRPGVHLRAAVDLPSGLGDGCDGPAFRADFTYMTGIAKAPLFQPSAAGLTGRLRYLDIGFFDHAHDPVSEREILLPRVLDSLRFLRPPLADKRRCGRLLLAGGSRRMPGAVFMATLAACRSGAGLVTALVPESMVPSFAPALPEAMWIGCPETSEGGLSLDSLPEASRVWKSVDAAVIGPGLGSGTETLTMVEEMVRAIPVPVVLDADALRPQILKAMRGAGMRGKKIFTPHEGEYARLVERPFAETGEDGLFRFAASEEGLVLLKGPPYSRICDGRRLAYGLDGGPVLARGGSGDLLAGMIGARLAAEPGDPWGAAVKGLVWHGRAADFLARAHGQTAVRTTDLLDFLGAALRDGEPSAGDGKCRNPPKN